MLVTFAPSSPTQGSFPFCRDLLSSGLDLDINVRCGIISLVWLLWASQLESLPLHPTLPAVVYLLSLFTINPTTSLSLHLFLTLSQLGLNFLVCGPEPHKYPSESLDSPPAHLFI